MVGAVSVAGGAVQDIPPYRATGTAPPSSAPPPFSNKPAVLSAELLNIPTSLIDVCEKSWDLIKHLSRVCAPK